ncbi:MAG: hypothetical protein ABJA02_09325 [Acidobacteriota bacterium]
MTPQSIVLSRKTQPVFGVGTREHRLMATGSDAGYIERVITRD